jgi:ribonuclease HII
MPWIVGMDEAGYGPNLGPFVMTSAACRVPDTLVRGDLWRVLKSAVRRPDEASDQRLLIADSKVVYNPSRGLRLLETGVLAVLSAQASTLGELLPRLSGTCEELPRERWFTGRSGLPQAAGLDDLHRSAALFAGACRDAGVAWGPIRAVIVCPSRFNALLDRHGTKGAVLADSMAELLRYHRDHLPGDDAVSFHVDKHGGRNTYAAQLHHALEEGMVVATLETSARSSYRVVAARRDLRFTFQPRADQEHFCVALASMVAKYLRELLMGEFNRFWLEQVPGLKPTAGYPGDAPRFWEAIQPTLEKLGLTADAVWRRK